MEETWRSSRHRPRLERPVGRSSRVSPAGGLGFLLGDGGLNYGREEILESYYTVHLWRGVFASAGLQYIRHPGYNQDRGPVLVEMGRLHVDF